MRSRLDADGGAFTTNSRSCLLHRFVKNECKSVLGSVFRLLSFATGVAFADTISVRESSILTNDRRRILLENRQVRNRRTTETNQTSTLGHGRHGAISVRLSIVLSRRGGRHSHLRRCVVRFVCGASDFPHGC